MVKKIPLDYFYSARERIHNVDYWMASFLKGIGTLIIEDGEEVLPTTMQPVTIEDFESYLGPYVGNKVRGWFFLPFSGISPCGWTN